MTKNFQERCYNYGKYTFIIHKDDTTKPIDECSFTQLYYDNERYNYNYKSPDNSYYRFICSNNRNKIHCQAVIKVTITRNKSTHTISCEFEEEGVHNEECQNQKKTLGKKTEDVIIHEKAINIAENYSYMTKNDVKIFFGYDDNLLTKIFNKIKTLKKNIVYYNLKLMLDEDNRYKLITKNSDENIIIFHQKWSFDVMRKSSVFYIDGTFSCVIKGYCQLFVINSAIGDNYFTTLLILLKNKEAATYIDMMKRIELAGKDYFVEFQFYSRRITLVCDFESGLLCLVEEFELIEMIGCTFHKKYACYRKLFSFGFPKKKQIDRTPTNYKVKKIENKFIESTEETDSPSESTEETETSSNESEEIKNMIDERETILKRTCSSVIEREDEEIRNIENIDKILIDNIKEFEKNMSELEFNYFVEKKEFIEVLKLNTEIDGQNKKMIIKIINEFIENDTDMFSPGIYMNSRVILKCVMNTCYLNQSFINQNLYHIMFQSIRMIIKEEYVGIIDKFEEYYMKTWGGKNALITNWNVFNSDIVANNVNESFNRNLNRDLTGNSFVKLPKFIFKMKLVFKENQERIEKWNSNTLPPQKAAHTKYKNCLTALMNYKLFNNELDVLSFLYLMIEVNHIKTNEDRQSVLQHILNLCNSDESKCRKIYLLMNNYKVNSDFKEEKKKFMEWIEQQKREQTVVGMFIMKVEEKEKETPSNENEDQQTKNQEKDENEMSEDSESTTSSSTCSSSKSTTSSEEENSSYDSNEMDIETREMIGYNENKLKEMITLFDIESENTEKTEFQVEKENDESIEKFKVFNDIEQLRHISESLKKSTSTEKEPENKPPAVTQRQKTKRLSNKNERPRFNVTKSDKLSGMMPVVHDFEMEQDMMEDNSENDYRPVKQKPSDDSDVWKQQNEKRLHQMNQRQEKIEKEINEIKITEEQIITNQQTIMTNQQTILANQDKIMQNQDLLFKMIQNGANPPTSQQN